MPIFDDSVEPYNNKFKASKQYDKLLFNPGVPVFQFEMNEMQSMENYQMEMLGDSLFQEGAIISGMDIIPQPDNGSSSSGIPNSFSIASLDTTNGSIETDTYTNDGNMVFTSISNLTTDYPALAFTGTVTKGLYSTMSFTIKRNVGSLQKFALDYPTSLLTPTVYTIDGNNVATNLNDMSGTSLVSDTGSQINLNDGNEHSVVITFKTLDSGSASFNLFFNPNYNALTNTFAINLGKLYIEDGRNVTDWQINVNDTGTSSSVDRVKNYSVTNGKIWLNGAVRTFSTQDISIKGIGTENIGVTLSESVVTSSEDPDLSDSTNNAVTNGMSGANRVKYTVNLTYNDDNATTIFVFQDNKINADAIKPDYSNLAPILAKRTFDQSGSFRTSGFTATTKSYNLDSSKIELDIDAGQAYVRGYSISTSDTTPLLLDKATSTQTTTNEGIIYSTGSGTYQLGNQPVQSVSNITANVEGTNSSVTRSTSGNVDTFTTNNAYRVVSVKQQSVTYTEGTDFVRVGNTLIWGKDANGNILPNATMPTAGTTYTVVYDYNYNMVDGTDYQVVTTGDTTSIDIDTMTGLKPINGSVINITYVFFLARIDMIMITQDQSNPFEVIQGSPMPLNTVTPPVVKDAYSLELGYVLIYPNSDKANFTLQTITRVPFSGLQAWNTRISNLEYSVAVQELSSSVAKSEDPVMIRDAFADSFNSNNYANTSRDDFSVAYDPEFGEITIPPKSYADLTPTLNQASSSVNVSGNLVTAPYTEEKSIGQDLATGVTNVNEYQIFNVNGTMTINPSSDNWIDTTSSTAYNTTTGKPIVAYRWWEHLTSSTEKSSIQNTLNELQGVQGIDYNNWSGSQGAANDWGSTQTGYIISDGGSKTIESTIQYMRERTITFEAQNFIPYEDGFSITIEGTAVLSPTPASSTYKGAAANTFKADAKGTIKGTFIIPGGIIPCGQRSIKIENGNNSLATTTYQAYGTLKNVENIINKTIVSVTLYDPLAQSFTLTNTKSITSVNLCIQSKPTSSNASHTSDLIVQIRELSDDGYPNRNIKGEQTLTPDQINVSDDASAITKVTFDQAIQITGNTGYCVVLISDSNAYNVFTATKGETTIGTNSYTLSGAPNGNGNLFTSNNAQTWIADATKSLKFSINTAHYNNSGTVLFDPIVLKDQEFIDSGTGSVVDIDRLATLTSYLTPGTTGLTWYIRILPNSSSATIDTMPWTSLTVTNDNTPSVTPSAASDAITNEIKLFEQSKSIQLKATFASEKFISPILTTEDLSLVGILTGTEGKYFSINLDESGDAEFDTVRMQFDAYIPNGASVTPSYSVDGGNTWYTLTTTGTGAATPVSTTQVSTYFTRYVYEGKVPTAVDQNHLAKQVMYQLDMKASTNFLTPRVRKLTSLLKNESNS